MLPSRVNHLELVELYMVYFDIIFWMNWLHDFFASIECRTRIVKFNFSNKFVLEWRKRIAIPKGRIISCIKTCKMISKGCRYNIIRVNDLDSKNPPIE